MEPLFRRWLRAWFLFVSLLRLLPLLLLLLLLLLSLCLLVVGGSAVGSSLVALYRISIGVLWIGVRLRLHTRCA